MIGPHHRFTIGQRTFVAYFVESINSTMHPLHTWVVLEVRTDSIWRLPGAGTAVDTAETIIQRFRQLRKELSQPALEGDIPADQ